MNLLNDITKKYMDYRNGFLTYDEMLDEIISLAENEKSYIIEYKANKRKTWKRFTDTIYTLTEVKAEIERINNNDAGIAFRYRPL